MKKVRIASVQARTDLSANYYQNNMEHAYETLREAAGFGADIICLPETYPGPRYARDLPLDPFNAMSSIAKEIGRYVVYGTCSDALSAPGRHNLVEVLLGPDGKKIGEYRRTCPPGPWIYNETGEFWDLNYIGENQFPVFDTDIGKIAMLQCSELFMPELSRIMAIKGAEILFIPAGKRKGAINENAIHLVRARAVENLM